MLSSLDLSPTVSFGLSIMQKTLPNLDLTSPFSKNDENLPKKSRKSIQIKNAKIKISGPSQRIETYRKNRENPSQPKKTPKTPKNPQKLSQIRNVKKKRKENVKLALNPPPHGRGKGPKGSGSREKKC